MRSLADTHCSYLYFLFSFMLRVFVAILVLRMSNLHMVVACSNQLSANELHKPGHTSLYTISCIIALEHVSSRYVLKYLADCFL